MRRRVITYVLVIVFILIAGLVGKAVILEGASVVSLDSDPLTTPVATALQGAPSAYLPLEGKDYRIKSTKYFGSKQWAVVDVQPVGNFSDSGVIVFHKQSGSYQKVYGPSNFVRKADLSSLPTDVIKYLDPTQ